MWGRRMARATGVIRILLCAAAAATLAGCTTGRIPPVADVRLPSGYEAGAQATLPASALDRWWTLYGDAELQSLVEQALAASPTVREAEARLDEARAIRSGALTSFDPQGALEASTSFTDTESLDDDAAAGAAVGVGVGGGAGAGGFGSTGESRSSSLGFNVSWELDLFGRRRAARRSADADLAAARFAFEGTRTQLAADTASSLFQARGLAIQLEDAAETVRIQTELLRVVRRRGEVGLSPTSDSARVEADLATARADSARLEAELRAQKRSLLVLVGRGTEATETLTVVAAVADPPPTPYALPGELLARRPDVREAASRLESAAGALTTAELDFFPRFTLLPGVGLSSQEFSGFESNTSFWSIGLGLSAPILDRPRLRSVLAVQTARAEQAVIGYERAVQTAFSEAEQTLVLLNADRERSALLVTGQRSARTAYDAAQRRYGAGLDDLQAVLDAERVWRANRSALAAARVQALQRSVQTFKALGGGWDSGTLATGPAITSETTVR